MIQLRADAENDDEIIPVQHDPVGAERIYVRINRQCRSVCNLLQACNLPVTQ
jgi:hypothetical protein